VCDLAVPTSDEEACFHATASWMSKERTSAHSRELTIDLLRVACLENIEVYSFGVNDESSHA
jgi:hypothetical protein